VGRWPSLLEILCATYSWQSAQPSRVPRDGTPVVILADKDADKHKLFVLEKHHYTAQRQTSSELPHLSTFFFAFPQRRMEKHPVAADCP